MPLSSQSPDDPEFTRSFQEIAYSHVHEEGAGQGRRWLAILVSIILIVSLFFFKPPANANWIWWSATLARLAIIVYLLVRYAREPD